MTTQIKNNIPFFNAIIDFILLADDPKANQYSASDSGYEISEEELANAMTGDVSANSTDPSTPQVSPDEFEDLYTWFIS